MDLKLSDLSRLERYKLLIGLVIPRPIAWVSTWSENGVANCAPYSFFNVFSEDPPLCMVSFGLRSDGRIKDSLRNIRRTGEFVVNLVDETAANAMHLSSEEFPPEVSEFEQAGLTTAPAALVQHPRIAEAAASLECRVYQRLEIGPGREFVIGEILLAHAREGVIDPKTKRISEVLYRPIGRLFGNRYCTTRERFNLPGPLPE
jgi:flavin reductase (DIM6/NTAB) family NADH-FMN oxidoreductase RutF